jgi:hypothetical protein
VSVADAAASGDRVTILRAMRDVLAARLDDPDARDASAVARELRAVLSELAEGPAEEADFVDELRARRAKAESVKRPAKG